MVINGKDIEPSKVEYVYITDTTCNEEPLHKVGVKYKDNSEICVGRFWNNDEAYTFGRDLEEKIKVAKGNEEEIVAGVIFNKAEKKISSRYLTIGVKEIDALFYEDSMIYVLKGNRKYSLIENNRSIKKLASYCDHLTEINGVYVNLDKVKGFFVNEETRQSEIYVACNNVLLRVGYTGYFEDAAEHLDKLREKYGVK